MADNPCKDLRRSDLNRPQSQVYLAGGKEVDAILCASFSSALLKSQQLGVSINPVDYAFQTDVTRDRSKKSPGYCRQKAVDDYLGKKQYSFLQSFADYVREVHGALPNYFAEMMDPVVYQKVAQWLDGICGQRIPDPAGEWILYIQRVHQQGPVLPRWAPQRWVTR